MAIASLYLFCTDSTKIIAIWGLLQIDTFLPQEHEEKGHLVQAEPNGTPFQSDVQLDRAVGRLIEHNLAAPGSQRFSDHLMIRC